MSDGINEIKSTQFIFLQLFKYKYLYYYIVYSIKEFSQVQFL